MISDIGTYDYWISNWELMIARRGIGGSGEVFGGFKRGFLLVRGACWEGFVDGGWVCWKVGVN